jgi:hypothetical protein
MTDHQRGCEGRTYTCTCGYDDQLVRIGPDAVEQVARAIMEASGGCIVKDWQAERRDNPHVELAWRQAEAVLAVLKGEE